MHFSIPRDAGEPVGYEQYKLATGHKQDTANCSKNVTFLERL